MSYGCNVLGTQGVVIYIEKKLINDFLGYLKI